VSAILVFGGDIPVVHMDVCFRGKARLRVDIGKMSAFDPKRTSNSLCVIGVTRTLLICRNRAGAGATTPGNPDAQICPSDWRMGRCGHLSGQFYARRHSEPNHRLPQGSRRERKVSSRDLAGFADDVPCHQCARRSAGSVGARRVDRRPAAGNQASTSGYLNRTAGALGG
jgi:hypothetical protein